MNKPHGSRVALRVSLVVGSLFASALAVGLTQPAGAASAANASRTAGAAARPPIHQHGAMRPAHPVATPIDLHAAYLARLAHVHPGPISGITYARGRAPEAPAAAASASGRTPPATCSEPDCPLVYHSGPVQHSPHVYLLLWGPHWTSDSSQAASATYLEHFYAALGVAPDDTWSTINSQYTDSHGGPTFGSSVYMGAFQDASTPPSGTTLSQFAAEADAFATAHSVPDLADAQIVVATQSGTCPQGFFAPGCAGGTGSYCAYHAASGEPFTNLPYLLDSGSGCGEDIISSTYDGFSIVGGHEYAETITDPQPNSGWWDGNDNSGGEIGDKCAWVGLNDLNLSNGTYAMQPLFSNSAYNSTGTGCVLASATWNVVLRSSPTTPQVEQPYTLTAQSNADVNGSGFDLLIETATGTILNACSSGTSCAVNQASSQAISHGYKAVVAVSNGSNPQATSNLTVNVGKASTSVSATALSTHVLVDQALTVDVKVTAHYTGNGFATPAGTVTVGGSTGSCHALLSLTGSNGVNTGSCQLSVNTPGNVALAITYPGDGSFDGSAGHSNTVDVTLNQGYWLVGQNGPVFAAGSAPSDGGLWTNSSNPVVGIGSTPDGRGYFIVTRNGTVVTHGDAGYYKDLPQLGVTVSNIVGIAPTADGKGYWLVGSDGGEFAFGDASYHGSLPGLNIHVNDIVGMVAAPSGTGYLMVGADGGVFVFGSGVAYHGSLPGLGIKVNNIRGILPTTNEAGYVLVGSDGGAFVFGSGSGFYGSCPATNSGCQGVNDVVGIALTPDDHGYWMAESDGRVDAFGDAQHLTASGVSSGLPIAAISGV